MEPEEEGLLVEPVVIRARDGDVAAFEELVERFRGPLLAYAEALHRDRGYAEDAVQEALLHAWRRLRDLREPTLFRPWLYAILENVSFSGLRRRKARPALPLFEGEAVAEGDAVRLPAPAVPGGGAKEAGAPVAARLWRSMASLPGMYRRILLLHYVDGRTTREVGDALGISRNNARVRLYRARGALRRELARRGVTADAPREVRS